MVICSLCFPPHQHLFSLLFPSFAFFVLNLPHKCFIMSVFFLCSGECAANALVVFGNKTTD